MKKTIIILLVSFLSAGLFAQDIRLPAPKQKAGVDLFDALRSRIAVQDFTKVTVSEADLSSILWAANGIKTTDAISGASKANRTTPYSGDNAYINVYFLNEKGAYLYDPAANLLRKVNSSDVRGTVSSIHNAGAAFMLVFTYDNAKVPSFLKGSQATVNAIVNGTAGASAQNAQIAAATVKLNSWVAYNMPKPADIKSALKLGKDELPLLFVQFGAAKQ